MKLLRWVPKDLTDDLVNTGSGNGLVPLGNKPFTWASVDQDLRHYMVSLGHNEYGTWTSTTEPLEIKIIHVAGPILGLRQANERWRYIVMMSLIGWVQA